MAIGRENEYTNGTNLIGLLFIEPKGPATEHSDGLTERTRQLVERHIYHSNDWLDAYKGVHCCSCGARSDSFDHYFRPPGAAAPTHITHALLLHYVQFHRTEIPAADLSELEAVLETAKIPK